MEIQNTKMQYVKSDMFNSSIHTLIFDLDNTLIDRNGATSLAIQLLLKTAGYHEPDRKTALEDIMQYDNWGYTDRVEFCTWFLHKYGKGEIRKLTPQAFLKVLQVMTVQRIQPDPQVQAALQSLATQFQFVLATNGGSNIQRAKLRQAALESFFQPEAIFISGEMECEKPDPLFFQKIIQQLQLDPGSTMSIGDNLINDIQAAAACGLFTCWVSHGREGVKGIQPNMVIKNVTETVKWTKQLI
jgi:putative hydrolase of the HAD superfamily